MVESKDKKSEIISKEEKFFRDAKDNTEDLILRERCTLELNEKMLVFLEEKLKEF